MRILQVSPYFIPYIGGQERYIYELSKKMIEFGNSVTVLTSNFPKSKSYEVIDGIEIYRFDMLGTILRNPVTPGILKYLYNNINKYDIIHTHNGYVFTSLLCTIIKTINDAVPLVLTYHGQLKYNDAFKEYFKKIYENTFGKMIYNSSNSIIVLSPSDKMYISSFGIDEDKIEIIPNAINIDKIYEISKNVYDLFLKYKIDKKNIILFVGPIIKRKGIDTFIESIPNVLKKRNETIFIIVGSGDYKKKAIEMVKKLHIENNIIFTGRISDAELYMLYKMSKIFVLPSNSEGVPTSILEAFVFSKPVISTTLPGIKDYFSNATLLIEPNNSKKLAISILKILEDDVLAKELSFKGNMLVKKYFTWNIVAKKVLNIYNKII
jgi:glycosyltransferase involved in cell wall biosynthesis